MEKSGKTIILIGAIFEAVSVGILVIRLFALSGSYDLVIPFLLVAILLAIALLVLVYKIYTDQSRSRGLVLALVIISGITTILSISNGTIPISGVLLLIGSIMLLVEYSKGE